MTMDTTGQWMGTPMDQRDIDDLLEASGYGILSLASDDEPYSLPISFGYDGSDVYFVFLEDSPDGRKFDFVEEGGTARLLVTDIGSRFDWQSIAVTGPVRRVPTDSKDWDRLVETLEDNAWFSSDFQRAGDIEEMYGFRLEPDEVRGLEVTES
ncbi:Pyridoxamine 5'-phosphate oxidase [Halorientalis persicus]|uniref:Pyridoxamine 5'-phosphate oxidase n=1 Tax=Halorientalis persicus TaxID=1367881 RepID=A0A1H8D9Y3_9EURY|nr:pyridoxamine 5'-phosphate oxidase family protein [Halorientalis persicus]SEN03368.1 Pyridoxamine 5'-phosphate oxidase [Halorientalis persicus]